MRMANHLFSGLAAMLLFANPVQAQEPQFPPAINPIPEGDGLPSGIPFDLSGIRLGSTFEEARAALMALNPDGVTTEPELKQELMALGDGKANAFEFLNNKGLRHTINSADNSSDTYNVTFSTSINESRVVSVERSTAYALSGSQGSKPAFEAALVAKFGEPSWREDDGYEYELHWVWADGVFLTANGDEASSDKLSGEGPESCAHNDMYRGCEASISVYMTVGQRDDLASRVSIALTDWTRKIRNEDETRVWAEGELRKQIEALQGVAPKL